MLQQRQISKVLQQGLKPIPKTTGSIKSISLLSSQGIPLITVSSTSKEDYKVYSILAYNSLSENPDNNDDNDDDWTVVQFENDLKCMISKVLDLHLVVYYDDTLQDEIVKLKSDGLISVLHDGLLGYNS
ncbi:hypothetical protein SBY92_004708 [Candida maltosa Xu316]